MGEINDILKRSKFDNLFNCLMNGIENDWEDIRNYDEIINESFKEFNLELKRLYPEINIFDEGLFTAITDFVITHNDVYFRAGATIGFQLYKEFEDNYKKHADGDITAILNKYENHNNSSLE